MSQSSDSNASVVFVGEQHKIKAQVHPEPPNNPTFTIPETQFVSPSTSTATTSTATTSTGGNQQPDITVISETSFHNTTGE